MRRIFSPIFFIAPFVFEPGGTGEGAWGFPQNDPQLWIRQVLSEKARHLSQAGRAVSYWKNYFLNEDEEFLLSAAEKYGAKGAKQAQALVDEVSGLFASGNIVDENLDVMMKALQDAYWIAKEKNKKFTPKKYRKDWFHCVRLMGYNLC